MQKSHEDKNRHIYGCMGLGGSWDKSRIEKSHINEALGLIETSLECGITRFDHADIYTLGKAETTFGLALKQAPHLVEQIRIQSKCGIRFADEAGPKRYDLSAAWVRQSVDNSLKQLGIEQLDMLLLHRPDPLLELDPLASTLSELKAQGKFRHLGVSNMHFAQIDYLQSALSITVTANQIEMSLSSRDWLEDGITFNTKDNQAYNFVAGTVEYCQRNHIELQAWGSLAKGIYTGAGGHAEQTTRELVTSLAGDYGVAPEAIVLAWLLRHPAHIHPVIGTTNHARLLACAQSQSIELSREHWYALLQRARGSEIP